MSAPRPTYLPIYLPLLVPDGPNLALSGSEGRSGPGVSQGLPTKISGGHLIAYILAWQPAGGKKHGKKYLDTSLGHLLFLLSLHFFGFFFGGESFQWLPELLLVGFRGPVMSKLKHVIGESLG